MFRDFADVFFEAEAAAADASAAERRMIDQERRAVDKATAKRLERAGIVCRPPHETVLVPETSGREIAIDETLERWSFAAHGRRRASEVAAAFDLFRETADLTGLRHVCLRPKAKKGHLGELASELARFSKDYNRWVGKLVTAGIIRPLLAVIHVRFDEINELWDLHAHCIWLVKDCHLDVMYFRLQTKFADFWVEKDKIKKPGALVNCASGIVDYRKIKKWSNEALVEFWSLSRPRFIRPAGEFAKFRNAIKDYRLVRQGAGVMLVPKGKRPARETSSQPVSAPAQPRVVGYTHVSIGGEKVRCAILKRPRAFESDPAAPPNQPQHPQPVEATAIIPVAADAGIACPLDVFYGDNRLSSPRGMRQRLLFRDIAKVLRRSTRTAETAPAGKPATRISAKTWWSRAWPSKGLRIPGPIRRRLGRELTSMPVGKPPRF